jgi:hypothetical protein
LSTETFEEVAKQAGEGLTKRILSDDFGYCMGHIAITDYEGKCKLNTELTLLEIKILETGLEEYKKSLQKRQMTRIDKGTDDDPYKSELEACDRILTKLKRPQIPIFTQLTESDISSIYRHSDLCYLDTWTG